MLTPEHTLVEGAVELLTHYVDPLVEKFLGSMISRRDLQSLKNREFFQPYFDTVIARCSRTKTLLYRADAVPLRDFYVDLDLRSPLGDTVATADIRKLFEEQGPSLLITGTAGCGKSTLLKHLFLQVIERKLGIPLFVELRHFTEFDGNVDEFIYEMAVASGLRLTRPMFDYLLEHGRFVLFLDGFDEISRSRSRVFSMQLERFDRNRQNLRTVVTSRPDYGHTFLGWHAFRELAVLPLTLERCVELIERLTYDADAKAAFVTDVREGLFDTHRSFLESPMLATLMLMMAQHFGKIHPDLGAFYGQAYETLRSRHDAIKPGFTRPFASSLDDAEFRQAVAAFAIQSYVADAVSFPEEKAREFAAHVPELVPLDNYASDAFLRDMVSSVCLLLQDGLELRFTHRSFQEYFAAIFILSFAGEKRRELLWNLRFRLNVDQTARLILELDHAAFEDDFMRSAIDALKLFLGCNPAGDTASCVIDLLRNHAILRVGRTDIDVTLLPDDAVTVIGIIGFIEREYYQHTLSLNSSDAATLDRLRFAAVQAQASVLAQARNVPIDEATAGLLRSDYLTLTDADYDVPAVRQALTVAFQPLVESIDRVISVFDHIDSERAVRNRSITQLLLN